MVTRSFELTNYILPSAFLILPNYETFAQELSLPGAKVLGEHKFQLPFYEHPLQQQNARYVL